MKDTTARHSERLARVEAELEHLPTKEMVLDLARSVARLDGKVEATVAGIEGVKDRVNGIGAAVDQLVENELRGHHK